MIKKPSPKATDTEPRVFFIVVLLIVLAVVSSIALDFLNSRRGDASYLFRARKEGPGLPAPSKSLQEVLTEGLIAAGVAPESLESVKDPKLEARIVVRILSALSKEAEDALDGWARAGGIAITAKTRTEAEGRIEFTWHLRAPDGREGEILFVFPAGPAAEAAPEKPSAKLRPKAPPARSGPGLVALIIDDMGSSLEALNDILSLGEPITVAVLPFSTFARETAEIAHSQNLEVILHLPLESQNNHESSSGTEGMIFAGMDEDEMIRILSEDLEQVPFIRGVNNHMGSRLTVEAPIMRTILGVLRQKGLFFVDSRTTSQTVAYEEALRMGVPTAMRDVFLDADEDRGMIQSRLLELFRVARNKGSAIGICHPFPETLQVLKEDFRLLREYGLTAVPVSKLLTKRD